MVSSMDPALAAELAQWKTVLMEELSAHLLTLREDSDIYGFALELPEDLSNMGVISSIGRESKLEGSKPGSRMALSLRYEPGDWESIPNGKTFSDSCDGLYQIGEKYSDRFVNDTTWEYTPEAEEFREALYAACLDTMAECDQNGLFGSIWYKVLTLSDAEHPIVAESFYRLNRDRALEEAARLYPRR